MRHKQGGFTFIEMVISAGLVGILAIGVAQAMPVLMRTSSSLEAKREANSTADRLKQVLGNQTACGKNLNTVFGAVMSGKPIDVKTPIQFYSPAGLPSKDASGNNIYLIDTANPVSIWFKPSSVQVNLGNKMIDKSYLGDITVTDGRDGSLTRMIPIHWLVNKAGTAVNGCTASYDLSTSVLSRICDVRSAGTEHWNASSQTCVSNTSPKWVMGTNPFTVSCPGGKHLGGTPMPCASARPTGWKDSLVGITRHYSNGSSFPEAPSPFNCAPSSPTSCTCSPATDLGSSAGFLAEAACM